MSGQTERPDSGGAKEASPAASSAESDASTDAAHSDADNTQNDTISGDEMVDLKARADENWDKYLRIAAELENVRKRAARDVANAHKYALERFAADLLDVRDSLEMALSTAEDASVESFREGSESTLKLLASVMQRFGVEELDPLGEPFDPEMHEAMTMQPAADAEPGSVLTVFQKGYALNGRLLRPARVVVAAEPQ